MNKYTLSLVRAVDQGMTPFDCIDEFQVKKDGQPAFNVIFDYNVGMTEEGKEMQVTIKKSNATDYISFDQANEVMKFLDERMSDHEFYADLFYDPNGHKVDLDLNW